MLLRVLLYGGAFFLAIPLVFAHQMTRSFRQKLVGDPPPGYESVSFLSEGSKLRGWLARGRPDEPAVIIAHGLGDWLESYQEHASFFIERGHSVLLIDFRGHGGSEGSRTSLGANEREDILAAMRYLQNEPSDLASQGVILIGHSMGAVAVLLAAGSELERDELDDVPELRAVIVEAPYDSFRNTVDHHAKLLYGLPRWIPVARLSILGAEWLAGFDADEADCVEAAKRFDAPLLAIVDGEDRRMPEPVVARIVEAHRGQNELWVAEGVDHVGAINHPDWRPRLAAFLDRHGIAGVP